MSYKAFTRLNKPWFIINSSLKAVYFGNSFSDTSVSSGVEFASVSELNTLITRSKVGLRLSSGRMVLANVGASGLLTIESIEALASSIPTSKAGS